MHLVKGYHALFFLLLKVKMCHHALLYRITTGLLSLIKVLYHDVDYAYGNNL